MRDWLNIADAAKIIGCDQGNLRMQIEEDMDHNVNTNIPAIKIGTRKLVSLRGLAQKILGVEYFIPERLADWLAKHGMAEYAEEVRENAKADINDCSSRSDDTGVQFS